jgi:hypothetical protein
MTPEAVMTPMSQVVPHLYMKTVFKYDIKLYNKLPEKNKKIAHNNFKKKKRAEIHTFARYFLYCRRIFTGSIVVVVVIGNRGK